MRKKISSLWALGILGVILLAIPTKSNAANESLNNDDVGEVETVILSWNEVPTMSAQTADDMAIYNVATWANGYSIMIMRPDKEPSRAQPITIDGNDYTAIKVSNGAQNKLILPPGKVTKKIILYSYVNTDAPTDRLSYWKEVAGTTYTEADVFNSYRDLSNLDRREYIFDATNEVTFTNTGEQCCYVLFVEVEDISSTTISVTLPEGTDVSDYANMWLELTNTESGETLHYVMTGQMTYSFHNISKNTSWNITLRNQNGDVFGQINDITVKNEDVSVAFPSLVKPQNITLSVITPNGKDVTSQTQVTWTGEAGNYLAQAYSLTGLLPGTIIGYRVVLPQELAMQYTTPTLTEYTVSANGNEIKHQLETIPQIQLIGKVRDAATNSALSGAVISASQTFGGKYSKTVSTKTDASGNYSLTISNVPTSLAVAATEYISQTFVCDTLLTGAETITVPEVSLKPINGAVISLGFTYTSSVIADGETEVQNWYSDYNNIAYTIYNKTKQQVISQFNVQYPQIVLLEEVAEGDVLELTATSKTSAFMPAVATAMIDAEQRANATFNIVELGKILASFAKNGNATVVGSLYNANGKLVKSYDYSNASLTISNLADGNYTLVSMGSSKLFNTIYDLSQLPQTGLVSGSDYVQNAVEVKSGVVSVISIDEVPTLDESKLYYTGDNTSFTVNKSSIVSGNYLTLTGHIDFKSAYATSVNNVNLVVDLPESCSLIDNSVMVGNNLSGYTLNGTRLTIPMNNYTDRVRFCIIPTLGGDYAPSAFAQFNLNGETITQPIGSAYYTAKDLSISVPPTVATTAIPVSGVTAGESVIEIYDGDVLIGQTNSLANGVWSTACELNEPYNLSTHNIYAKVTTKTGLDLVSETKNCTYDMNAIQVSKVTMYHWNPEMRKTYVSEFDFLNPKNSATQWTVYYPKKVFTYTIEFTNNDPERISNVILYVHTADGQFVPVNAIFDKNKGFWYAEIDMGSSSNGYYPVNVSIDYDVNNIPFVDNRMFKNALNELEQIGIDLQRELKNLANTEIEDKDEIVDDSGFLSFEELLKWDEEYVEENSVEINVDSVLQICSAISNLFILSKNEEIKMPDGSIVIVKTCSGISEMTLEEQGYEKYETVDRTAIYVLNTENLSIIVDFSDDLYFEIRRTLSEQSILSCKAFGLDEFLDEFNEWVEKINSYYMPIRDAYEDLQSLIGDIVSNLEYDLEKFADLVGKYEKSYKTFSTKLSNAEALKNSGTLDSWQLNEIEKKIASYKASKTKYRNLLNAANRSKWFTEKTLPCARKLAPQLKKICPLLKYTDMITQGVKIIHEYRSLYVSVPAPCPNDSIRANQCKIDVRNGGAWIFGILAAKLGVQAVLDIGVASQAVGSIATGGITLVTAFATAVGKMVLGIALDSAFDSYNKNKQKSLQSEIKALKCSEDPCDGQPCPDSPEGNGDSGNGHGGANDSGSPNDNVQIDPSGYVYEGVATNRIEGVTATIYYKEIVEDMYGELHENIVKWNAEEYAQENPLFTDENGYYRWDVPQGMWQVKFEKEGYETTYSEWLPVPPPQLDVNIAMKQSVQPNVLNARAYEDAIEVEFDKYMMTELLNTENITVKVNGKNVEGTIKLLNEEVGDESITKTFASKVRFNAAEPFDATEVTLTVNNRVKSYADIRMQDNFSQTFTIEQEIRQIVCDSVSVISHGAEGTLTVTVLPASASAGKTLNVHTSSSMILGVAVTSVVLDDKGKAEIPVTGELPGVAAVTFTIDGYDLSGTTIVNVKQIETVAKPAANIASGTTVEKGTEVTLSCSTAGATIYYTLDGSCPCDPASDRKVYDGTPIVITESITIKAMAAAPDMEESDVVEFVYLVETDGIDDVVTNGEIRIYPIPVHDKLNVTADGKIVKSVKVYSQNGVLVASSNKPTTTVTLDVSTIAAGIYIVHVQTENRIRSCKIIKM